VNIHVSENFEPLLGTDEATLDEKGRILFSKKKRDRLGEHFTVGVGTVGCLVAYPRPVWLDLVKSILSQDPTNLGREIYTRYVLGQADDDLKFDAQGRVIIPQKLREIALIKDKGQVVLVGCGDRLEIWSKEEHAKYEKDPEVYGQERREAILRAQRMMRGA
jgi:MraZ protein